MIYYWDTLKGRGISDIRAKTGVGEPMQWILMHKLADHLGDLCKVLPAVHPLTGSDYTSKFGTKYAALRANPERCLIEFGQSLLEPNLSKNFIKC